MLPQRTVRRQGRAHGALVARHAAPTPSAAAPLSDPEDPREWPQTTSVSRCRAQHQPMPRGM